MRRPPATRRRFRPALAAAVGCGVLGGSLVGIGALGFDKVEVAAAVDCIPLDSAPAASDAATPAPAPDEVIGQPISAAGGASTASTSDVKADEAALAALEPGPMGDFTTVVPEVGPKKPYCEPESPVIVLPGGDEGPVVEPDGDEDPDAPVDSPDPDEGTDPDEGPDPDEAPTRTRPPTRIPRRLRRWIRSRARPRSSASRAGRS